jgi:hypothetical protein
MANTWIPFNPTYMKWADWQGYMLEDWAELGLPMVQEEAWRDFAHAFVSRQGIAKYALPEPNHYKDWKSWARDLQTAVNG